MRIKQIAIIGIIFLVALFAGVMFTGSGPSNYFSESEEYDLIAIEPVQTVTLVSNKIPGTTLYKNIEEDKKITDEDISKTSSTKIAAQNIPEVSKFVVETFSPDFNNLRNDNFISLVDSISAGGMLMFSMYGITDTGVSESLVAAHQRGVDIQGVIDFDWGPNGKVNSNQKLIIQGLIDGLGVDSDGNNRLAVSSGSSGSQSIHTKIVVSKQPNGVTTSEIHTGNLFESTDNGFNLVARSLDKNVHDELTKILVIQLHNAHNPEELKQLPHLVSLSSNEMLRTAPHSQDILTEMEELFVLDGINTIEKVRIAIPYISDPNAVKKMIDLHNQGKQVQVITTSRYASNPIDELRDAGIDVLEAPVPIAGGFHSKTIEISGTDSKGKNVSLATIGSANLLKSSVKVDEINLITWSEDSVSAISDAIDSLIAKTP